MIYLHKILPMVLLPIGLTVILGVAGLLLRKPALIWIGLGLLLLASTPLVADTAMRTAEGWQTRRTLNDIPPAQAIVVLSNGTVIPPGDGATIEWDSSVDRFDAGVALFQAGKAPLLVLTGGWLPWQPAARPAGNVLAERAVELGVPADQVLVTGKVMNTAGEAEAVAQTLREDDPTAPNGAVILVTSAYHMRRAQLLFEQAGMEVIPFPVDFQVSQGHVFTILDLLPQADSLSRTEIALRELYGYLYYALRGAR